MRISQAAGPERSEIEAQVAAAAALSCMSSAWGQMLRWLPCKKRARLRMPTGQLIALDELAGLVRRIKGHSPNRLE